jgi:hypothetical protein
MRIGCLELDYENIFKIFSILMGSFMVGVQNKGIRIM